jgi:Ca-activated chloride channel family protein
MVRICSPALLLSLAALFVPLTLPANARAQNPDLTAPPAVAELHSRSKPLQVDVNLVLVPVTVTDQQNRPVLGLGQGDFTVSEDGVEQVIRYFSTDDEPISLGVLLDVSGSMKNKIDIAREAVVEFFKTSHPDDDYFVITFSDDPLVLADSTRSIGYIQDRMTQAKPAGHTALLDAVYLGVSKMRRARYKRRALLVISDGGDNHSRYTTREVARVIEEADVQIFAIGIFDSVFRTPEEWSGKRLLNRLTEASGGRVLTIRNAAQLPEAADAVSLELRNQYVLGYQPTGALRNGVWHKLKVRLTKPPKKDSERLHVYTRSGYFAPGN